MNFRFNTDSWVVFSIFFVSFLSLFILAYIAIPYATRRSQLNRIRARCFRKKDRYELLEIKYSTQQIIQLREKNEVLRVDISNQLSNLIRSNSKESDLVSFFSNFEKIYPSFGTVLHSRIPDMTTSEVRLCILLRLNLSSKEVAKLLNITQESVNKARYRLRKKIGLIEQDDLYTFLQTL